VRLSSALRTVALFEAAKGAVVLLAGLGLLSLVHHDMQRLAEEIVGHFHLNPGARYPRIFLDAAAQVTDGRLLLVAAGALAYAIVRFIEAYGLWRTRHWAQWFAAISGAIYIPFELLEIARHTGWMSVGALVLNAVVVGVMLYGVRQPQPDRSAR
jgi:uncharacterized membrane protein (DUF2068 family)